jgi:hypothetical protein
MTNVEQCLSFPTIIYTPRYDKRSTSYELFNIDQAAASQW